MIAKRAGGGFGLPILVSGEGGRDIYLYDRQTQELLPTPGLNSKWDDFDFSNLSIGRWGLGSAEISAGFRRWPDVQSDTKTTMESVFERPSRHKSLVVRSRI